MTFDPTKNRIVTWALTEEELSILKAAKHGWEATFDGAGGWVDCPNPVWLGRAIYRAKPASAVTSRWFNVYPTGTGYASFSRMEIETHAIRRNRIAVLRIDTCNGVVTAHLEPLKGGDA